MKKSIKGLEDRLIRFGVMRAPEIHEMIELLEKEEAEAGTIVRAKTGLADESEYKLILEEGFEAYRGGVYNPGVFQDESGIHLLARAESFKENERARDPRKMMSGAIPLWIRTDGDFQVRDAVALKPKGFPAKRPYRIEDFRLFRFGNEIWVNHSLLHFQKYHIGGALDYEGSQALSRMDLSSQTLEFIGEPELDRAKTKIEKNWVYLERDGELYLFYFFYPVYVVKKLVSREKLLFQTIVEMPLAVSGIPAPMLSYSTNPVEFDEDHYLVVVHARMKPGNSYAHWAALIDKETLCPVQISEVPLIRAFSSRGVYSHVVFVTGVVRQDGFFSFIFGEGDSHTSFVRVSKADLVESFIPI